MFRTPPGSSNPQWRIGATALRETPRHGSSLSPASALPPLPALQPGAPFPNRTGTRAAPSPPRAAPARDRAGVERGLCVFKGLSESSSCPRPRPPTPRRPLPSPLQRELPALKRFDTATSEAGMLCGDTRGAQDSSLPLAFPLW